MADPLQDYIQRRQQATGGDTSAAVGPDPIPAAQDDPLASYVAANQGRLQAAQTQADTEQMGGGSSPNDPIQESPVSMGDRLKLSFGNDAGNMMYLKGKFDDVQKTDKHGLVVQRDGKWYQVHPDYLGSAAFSEKLKDLATDTPSALISGATTGANAAGAAVLASPAGPGAAYAAGVAGAGVGGAEGSAINKAIGSELGTYQDTPQNALKDSAWEGLLAAGGQAALPGIEKGLGAIAGAAKKIGGAASDAGKAALAQIWGQSTGAGPSAIKTLFDNPGKVVAGIKQAISGAGGDTEVAARNVVQKGIDTTGKLLDSAEQALPKKWADGVTAMVNSPQGAKMKVDMGEVVNGALQALDDSGFGRIVSTDAAPTSKSTEAVRTIFDGDGNLVRTIKTNSTVNKAVTDAGTSIERNGVTETSAGEGEKLLNVAGDSSTTTDTSKVAKGGVKFEPFSPAETAQRGMQGQPMQPALSKDTSGAINDLVTQLHGLADAGTVNGPAAAKMLVGYNKLINTLERNAVKGEDPSFQAAIGKVASAFREQVGKQFADAGMGDQYTGLAKLYADYGNQVSMARAISNSPTGTETLFNQLGRASGAQTKNTMVDKLVELTGDQGAQLRDQIAHLHAVSKLLPALPTGTAGVISRTAGTFGAGALAMNPAHAVAAIPMAALAANASPRLVANGVGAAAGASNAVSSIASKALPYMQQFTGLMKSMSPGMAAQFLRNDQAIQHAVGSTMQSFMAEDQDKQALINGAINGH